MCGRRQKNAISGAGRFACAFAGASVDTIIATRVAHSSHERDNNPKTAHRHLWTMFKFLSDKVFFPKVLQSTKRLLNW